MPEAAAHIVGVDGAGGVIGAPGLPFNSVPVNDSRPISKLFCILISRIADCTGPPSIIGQCLLL